jgi:hypothetical protein
MDIEWLLSTLFDASLLSPRAAGDGGSFFVPFRGRWTKAANFMARRNTTGNYVAKFEGAPSGQDGAGRVMLT